MKLLPGIALIASCTGIPGECEPQLERAELACDSASVVGENDNRELYKAVDDLKACVGEDVRVVCSDDSWQNILTVTRK